MREGRSTDGTDPKERGGHGSARAAPAPGGRGPQRCTAYLPVFTHDTRSPRVVFGAGSLAALHDEAARLGLGRVLVLSTPGRRALAERIADRLGARAVGVHAEARMHVPVETARRACGAAADADADGCVAVGGGSAIGLGKAVARDRGCALLAVPTTYSGSEMTSVWGMSENGEKRTGRDERVRPRTVVYDPELTLELPVGASVSSGMNALAHAVEALYAPDASPVVALMAEEGVRAIAGALPRIAVSPAETEARSAALYGAWLCGACLGATTMSLHHKLCHVLGGLGLPHAETHAVVLPHVLAYNAPGAPEAMAALGRALDTAEPARAIQALAARLGAPRSLAELGLAAAGIDRVAELALRTPYANPREVTAEGVRGLLHSALRGRAPVPAAGPDRA